MPTARVLRHCAAALRTAPSAATVGRLAGKTTIVTGAAHGIGKATATLFANEGAHVILADRDVLTGQAVAQLIEAQSHNSQRIVFVECDVSDIAAVTHLIDVAQTVGGGKIDSLVNVAGVDIIAKLEDTDPDRWDRVMAVNLRSVYLTCKTALPYLRAAGRASIVNVSSIQASRGFSGYPGYAATKAGILGFTRQIAVDYATARIRVNAVSPGPVTTDLGKTSLQNEPDFPPLGSAGAPDIAAEESSCPELPAKFDPSPRLFGPSLPMDVAYAILFLACDESAAMTGIDLPVDGGFSIKGIANLQEGHDPAVAATMAEPGKA